MLLAEATRAESRRQMPDIISYFRITRHLRRAARFRNENDSIDISNISRYIFYAMTRHRCGETRCCRYGHLFDCWRAMFSLPLLICVADYICDDDIGY